HVETGNAHRMVVIPERRSVLFIRIVSKARLTGHVPRLRIPIALRRHPAAMQVRDSSDFGLVRFRAVDVVVNWQKVLLRQAVDPFDQKSLTAVCFERRSGYACAVSPLPGWRNVAMQPCAELLHLYSVVRQQHLAVLRAGSRACAYCLS